jgi:hypothetical protein
MCEYVKTHSWRLAEFIKAEAVATAGDRLVADMISHDS